MGYGAPFQPARSNKALWSMILGIVGLGCCSPLGIAALIMGYQARSEIRASQGAQTGDGMAQAGLILGIIDIVLLVISVILFSAGTVSINGHTG
ncbi:MAG: DUF4190 domain-containing protein [Nocardioidaceae bacterium]